MKLKIEKIGYGYFRSGYGRTSKRNATIYLIDGFLYAKDKQGSKNLYAENEITKLGYVPINIFCNIFHEASLHTNDHRPYVKMEKSQSF